MSGVEFWLLKTYTLIWWPLIWASMAALSAAVGSDPSLMAVRKLGGVSTCSPRASDSGAKMLSDAPTGVPAYLALMPAIRDLYEASPVVVYVACWASKKAPSAGS